MTDEQSSRQTGQRKMGSFMRLTVNIFEPRDDEPRDDEPRDDEPRDDEPRARAVSCVTKGS